MGDAPLDALVSAVRARRKYATVAEPLVRRLSEQALRTQASISAAERLVRAKLHQVHGAYLTPGDLAHAERALARAPADPAPEDIAALAHSVLARHASTRERLGFQEELYPQILAATSPPAPSPPAQLRKVLDLGCGFHPFALPWMGLGRETEYLAYDIDTRLLALADEFLRLAKRPGRAAVWDLLAPPPPEAQGADLAFCLKTLPLLDQLRPGAALRLLGGLSPRAWIVSFPSRTLGGREKGMRATYAARIEADARALGRRLARIDFPTETFYILTLA